MFIDFTLKDLGWTRKRVCLLIHRIVNNYRDIDKAFAQIPHLICYALKANSNLDICRILAKEECGADVVGPICKLGDFLEENIKITKPEAGSFIVVKDTGAYGFSMSSNYNTYPRPPEIIVDKKNFFVARERKS